MIVDDARTYVTAVLDPENQLGCPLPAAHAQPYLMAVDTIADSLAQQLADEVPDGMDWQKHYENCTDCPDVMDKVWAEVWRTEGADRAKTPLESAARYVAAVLTVFEGAPVRVHEARNELNMAIWATQHLVRSDATESTREYLRDALCLMNAIALAMDTRDAAENRPFTAPWAAAVKYAAQDFMAMHGLAGLHALERVLEILRPVPRAAVADIDEMKSGE